MTWYNDILAELRAINANLARIAEAQQPPGQAQAPWPAICCVCSSPASVRTGGRNYCNRHIPDPLSPS